MIFNVNSGAGKIPINVVPNTASSFTYDGSEKTPVWQNYDPEQLSISGNFSATNAGEYTAYFTPKADYEWWDGTSTPKEVKWSIAKAVGTLSLSATSGSIDGEQGTTTTFTVNYNGDAAISVVSSNTGVATASISGKTVTVKSVASGSATITVSAGDSSNYTKPSNVTYSVSIVAKKYLFKSGTGQVVGLTIGYEYNNMTDITSNYVYFKDTGAQAWIRSSSKIDISKYTKLCAEVTCAYNGTNDTQIYCGGLRVASSAWTTANSISTSNYAAIGHFSTTSSRKVFNLNIASITGSYYVGISGGYGGYVYNMWLE
jgi:hypothetical protein